LPQFGFLRASAAARSDRAASVPASHRIDPFEPPEQHARRHLDFAALMGVGLAGATVPALARDQVPAEIRDLP
jgi:hypothetical protein